MMIFDIHRKKEMRTGKTLAAFFLFLLMMILWTVPAFAAETEAGASDTVVLSGMLTEDMEIPEEVRRVVLEGVSGEGVTVTIGGDATVEIADATENSLYMIAGAKSLRFTGGGNLDLIFGITVQGTLGVFDHTGAIRVSEGTIMSFGGKLIFNSGIVTVHADERVGEGIFAVEGDVVINGGDITSDGTLGAIVAQNNMELNGGRITASSDTMPIYAAFTEEYTLTVSDRVKESGFDAVPAAEGSPAMALSVGEEAGAGTIVLKTEDDVQMAEKSLTEFEKLTAGSAEGNAGGNGGAGTKADEGADGTGAGGSTAGAAGADPAESPAEGDENSTAASANNGSGTGSLLGWILAAVVIAGGAAYFLIKKRKTK